MQPRTYRQVNVKSIPSNMNSKKIGDYMKLNAKNDFQFDLTVSVIKKGPQKRGFIFLVDETVL